LDLRVVTVRPAKLVLLLLLLFGCWWDGDVGGVFLFWPAIGWGGLDEG